MLHKRHSFGTRKVSPPQPTCMTDDQKASYLKSLRSNRPARPTGSRPLPARPSLSKLSQDYTEANTKPLPVNGVEDLRLDSLRSNRLSLPNSGSLNSLKGRPLATVPRGTPTSRKVTPPEIRYRESTLRQKEKLEAQSLRKALEEVDGQDEDSRIHRAAQLEAANLVWEHRNPGATEQEKTAPYRNPDLVKKTYVVRMDGSALDSRQRRDGHRNVSGSSTESSSDTFQPLPYRRRSSRQSREWILESEHNTRFNSTGSRKVSSGSSKGIFRNPEDEIYEEPEFPQISVQQDLEHTRPLRTKSHNPSLRDSRSNPGKVAQRPSNKQLVMSRSQNSEWEAPPPMGPEGEMLEIRSQEIRAATSMKRSERSPKLPTPTAVSDKLGRPIVSFDPSWKPIQHAGQDAGAEVVSPRPLPMRSGKPIARESNLHQIRPGFDQQRQSLRNSVSPPIPILNLPDEEVDRHVSRDQEKQQPPSITISTPEIAVFDATSEGKTSPVPQINFENHERSNPSLPAITGGSRGRDASTSPDPRTTSKQSSSENTRSHNRLPWLSRQSSVPTAGGSRAATVTCSACDLPISGRIVTASGASNIHKARFHPECFTCFHCSTGLECVSFYPEPESSLLDRLGTEGEATVQAVDLRFYCHLDYHDLFSPRCGSCHTPIEGVVIVAAGKSWHEGHFFCAECGDPFSSTSPFVEAQGYAYCVGCHTKRTSARCRACKKQILDDITVEALGGKWHEACFRCDECGDDFGNEGKFFVREVDIELTEKEKRKGLNYHKVEERAVCDACEAKRLKSRDVAAFL